MAEITDEATYIYLEHVQNSEGEGVKIFIPAYPDQIADTLQSTFNQTQGLSRTAPVFSYVNSGPRSVQVNIPLQRDMMDDLNENKSNVSPEDGEDYSDMCIRYLRAVALPNYDGNNREVIPPTVAVKFGEEVFIYGVVSSGVTVTYEKPILSNGKYSFVTISFTVYEIEPHTADEVAAGGINQITQRFQGVFD